MTGNIELNSMKAAFGATAVCSNETQGLGAVIVEWSVKFIFDQLPNDDHLNMPADLRDGQSASVTSVDARCCVAYWASVKFTWPQGQDTQFVEGHTPAGKCYVNFAFGLRQRMLVSREELAKGISHFEIVKID